MTETILTISSKNYSSWSLRGWLLCRMAGLKFVEEVVPVDDPLVVPMVDVSNVYLQTLANYITTAQDALGVPPPYYVEMGAVGLWNMCLSLPVPHFHNEVSGPVYEGEFKRRSILNDISVASQQTLVEEFIAGLYDLVGIGS
jgi:hypothetical protein